MRFALPHPSPRPPGSVGFHPRLRRVTPMLMLSQPPAFFTYLFAYSESKLTFHFVVLVLVVLVLLRRKVEKDGNAKKGPFY